MTDERFLDDRLDTMWHGVRDAIREEVSELRRLKLPVYVAENGHVVDLTANGTTPTGEQGES